ncbi:hypothetical protein KUTeg_017243 [Tegillarca granosa]|uniref:HTH psq-type domain-containing protein n=1 Tax=Tegillarca granosa TaxID=220873 RepID=A0ABQ9ELF3_TEGGR|nr:hypothetical protein KUTeg_017243 [Tegillarca granosa]
MTKEELKLARQKENCEVIGLKKIVEFIAMSKSYSEEDLSRALSDIRSGGLSLRAASIKYGVPRSTLSDRKVGKVQEGAKWGKRTVLPFEKEKELIEYAQKRSDLGIGFSKQNFLRFAAQYAKLEQIKFRPKLASEKWWRGLKSRLPDFSLRTPEPTSSGRHSAMTQHRVSQGPSNDPVIAAFTEDDENNVLTDPLNDTAIPVVADKDHDLVVQVEVHATHDLFSAVDLPLSMDETGNLSVLSSMDTITPSASVTTEPSVQECSNDLALNILESTMTESQKECFNKAFTEGRDLDDPMFGSWAFYKSKLTKVDSSSLLVFPSPTIKQQKRVSDDFFVITADKAYEEKIKNKKEKERKRIEVEDRKKQRLEAKIKKEQLKQEKSSKKGRNIKEVKAKN